ncbi:MAG: SDR family NAD(P)-dependent oxidoreductase [Xanthomonadales bacterium]|jgi:NAD(P)-dependent dehydrogenase (short-subunit alcohol dehydrogenase family)|nr:SDR family NAD(P)-dependent oxidoreductase [Xanthomonadales bacterium]
MTDNPTPNVLITGATGGLGKALALACASRGARVILIDRNKRLLERLCDEVEALGAPAPGYCDVDLATVGPEQVQELVAGLDEAYGPVSGLVHAAVRFDGLRPLDQIAPQDWLLDLQVNLNVAWLLTLACLPGLKSSGGTVVFLVDGDAEGQAYWGSYGASKAALKSLASTLSEELGNAGCRALAIDPGPMRTDLRATAYLGENPTSVPPPSEAAERIADVLLRDESAA